MKPILSGEFDKETAAPADFEWLSTTQVLSITIMYCETIVSGRELALLMRQFQIEGR